MTKDKYQFDIVLNTISKDTGSKSVEKALNQISKNADKTNKELSKLTVTVNGNKLTRPFQRMNRSLRQIDRNTKHITKSLQEVTVQLNTLNSKLSSLNTSALGRLERSERNASNSARVLNQQISGINRNLNNNSGRRYFDEMDRSIKRSTRSVQQLYRESVRVGRGQGSRYRQGMLRTTAPYAMVNPMLGLFGFFGLNSMKEIAFDTGVRNETNKILLENIGGEYEIFDKVTNESLTSIQDLIPAMNAVKAADNLTAEQVNAHASDLAQFGAYAKILSGSQDRANEAMMRLGKAFNGQYTGVDQYGITADSLRHVGYEPNEPDFDKFMAAVNKIMGGSMEEIMQTTQGQIALTYKSFTKAGKEIGATIMPVVKQVLHLFNALNTVLKGIPAKLLIIVSGALSLAAIFTNTYNEVMAVADTFHDMRDRFRRLIGEEEGPAFGDKFKNRSVIDAINDNKGVGSATDGAKQSVRSFTESIRNFAHRVKWEAEQLLRYPEYTMNRWSDYFTKPKYPQLPEYVEPTRELPGDSPLGSTMEIPTTRGTIPIEHKNYPMLEAGPQPGFHKSYKTFERPDRSLPPEVDEKLNWSITSQGKWNEKKYVAQNDWQDIEAKIKSQKKQQMNAQVRESAKSGFASTVYSHPLSFTDKLRLDQLQQEYAEGTLSNRHYKEGVHRLNNPAYPAQRKQPQPSTYSQKVLSGMDLERELLRFDVADSVQGGFANLSYVDMLRSYTVPDDVATQFDKIKQRQKLGIQDESIIPLSSSPEYDRSAVFNQIKQTQKLSGVEQQLEKVQKKRAKTSQTLDVQTKRINRSREKEHKQRERELAASRKKTVQTTLTFNSLNDSYRNVANSTSRYNSELNTLLPTTIEYGKGVANDKKWLDSLNQTTSSGTGILNTFNTALDNNSVRMNEDALSAENLTRAMQQLAFAEERYNAVPALARKSTVRSTPWYALPQSEIPFEEPRGTKTKTSQTARDIDADEIIMPDGSRFDPNSDKEKARRKVHPRFQEAFDDRYDDAREFAYRDWKGRARDRWEDSNLYGKYNYAKYKVGNRFEQSEAWQNIRNSEFADDVRSAYGYAKTKYRPRMGEGSDWKEKILGANIGAAGYAGMFGGQILGMTGGAIGGDFGDLMSKMGNSITIIAGFAQMAAMVKESETAMRLITAIFGRLKNIVPVLMKIVPIIQQIGTSLMSLVIAQPEILVVLLAVIAALAIIRKYWDNIVGTVQKFAKFVQDVLVTAFVEPLIPLFEALDDVWNALTGLFSGGSGDLLVDLGNAIIVILQPIGENIKLVAKALGFLIRVGITPFVQGLQALAGVIKTIHEGFTWVKDKIMAAVKPILDFFNMIGEKVEWLGSLIGVQSDTNPEVDYNKDGEPDKDGKLSSWAKGLVEARDHPQTVMPQKEDKETKEKTGDMSSLEDMNLESTSDIGTTDLSIDTTNMDVEDVDTTDVSTKTTTPKETTPVETKKTEVESPSTMNVNAQTVQLNAQHIGGWGVKDQQNLVDAVIVQQNQAALNRLKSTAQREHYLAQQLREKHNNLFSTGHEKEKESITSFTAEVPMHTLFNQPFMPLVESLPQRMNKLIEKAVLPPFLMNKMNPSQPNMVDKVVTPATKEEASITNYITVNVDNVSDESHIKNMVDAITKVLTWDNIRAGRTIGLGDK